MLKSFRTCLEALQNLRRIPPALFAMTDDERRDAGRYERGSKVSKVVSVSAAPFAPPPAVSPSSQPGTDSQTFQQKMDTLMAMGFPDRSRNATALFSAEGDVTRAVEILANPSPQ